MDVLIEDRDDGLNKEGSISTNRRNDRDNAYVDPLPVAGDSHTG